MKGWYGNKQAHSLASRGISSRELNKYKRERFSLGKKDLYEYSDQVKWKNGYKVTLREIYNIIWRERHIKDIEEEIHRKIMNYEIEHLNYAIEYIYELENQGLINKVEASYLLDDTFGFGIQNSFNDRWDEERRIKQQKIDEETDRVEMFKPYDPINETHSQYIQRVKGAVYTDTESLFYNPELDLEEE